MKRLWIALALLGAIFAGTLIHVRSLHRFTDSLVAQLDQAEEQAEGETADVTEEEILQAARELAQTEEAQ